MIIEGNQGIRELYRVELEDSGYDVVTVEDVTAVKQMIGSSRPDLVIMDPWIGGEYRWDLLSGIKERHSLIPVLLCLTYDTALPRDVARLADGVILKSSSFGELLLKLTQITGKTRT